MKYHNTTILCLTYDELVPVIMNADNYHYHRRNKNITVHGRGGNGNEILIEFETLPEKFKADVIKKYGNPYEYIAKQPLLEYVKFNWDTNAEDFYRKHILSTTNSKLPEAYIPKYTKAATWLNAIQHFTTDKAALKRTLNISVAAFWSLAGDLITANDIALPANEKRLREKLSQYKKDGYAALIEAFRFGNNNSKKVKDEVAEALLIKMLAHPHKHDDTIIAAEYNKWAKKAGKDTITPGAVKYWRTAKAHLITLSREGAAINYTKYSKQIKRARPTEPMMLINSDDNVLDLYFSHETKNSKGKIVKNNFYRPVAYIIIDTFNDYILGYAIGPAVTIDLIRLAYLNAIRHVMELTGGAYLWHQIQTDHWSIDPKLEGPLATFFKDQTEGRFTPASVKVAQAKYIERSFGVTWHQQLKYFPNYSGHNITAKEKNNPDAIQLASKNYPHKQHAPEVVAELITRMRHTTNPKTGLSRQQEWVEAFKKAQHCKTRQIDTEKRLQLFGLKHPFPNRITSGGLRVQISNIERYYEVPNEIYLESVNKKVEITYDPYDMSHVLVSNGKGLRFVANEYEKMPAALADYKPDTAKKLHEALEFKKQIPAFINETMDKYSEVLQRADIDAQSILQAGVKTKQISHDATHLLTGNTLSISENAESLHLDQVIIPAPAKAPKIDDEFDWRNEL